MTNFKEFLRSQKQNEKGAQSNTELVLKIAAEWARLKAMVQTLAAGESYQGETFAWAPYGAAYTDFVKLTNVAAIFRESRNLPDSPLICEILFGRRPLAANEIWSVEKSPSSQVWHLTPRMQGGERTWQVKELHKSLSTEELANEVLVTLVKYFDEYESFYRTGQWLG